MGVCTGGGMGVCTGGGMGVCTGRWDGCVHVCVGWSHDGDAGEPSSCAYAWSAGHFTDSRAGATYSTGPFSCNDSVYQPPSYCK